MRKKFCRHSLLTVTAAKTFHPAARQFILNYHVERQFFDLTSNRQRHNNLSYQESLVGCFRVCHRSRKNENPSKAKATRARAKEKRKISFLLSHSQLNAEIRIPTCLVCFAWQRARTTICRKKAFFPRCGHETTKDDEEHRRYKAQGDNTAMGIARKITRK